MTAVTGQPLGSVPTPASGYLFAGWFEDADCTRAVSPALVQEATGKLTPAKAEGTIWQDNQEYFAKFIPKESKLTVMLAGTSPLDANQSFLFRIRGVADTETEGIDLSFNLHGNGTVVIAALPIGDYVVDMLEGWSWRYEASEARKHVTLVLDEQANSLLFTVTRTENKWLDGNVGIQNIFGQNS